MKTPANHKWLAGEKEVIDVVLQSSNVYLNLSVNLVSWSSKESVLYMWDIFFIGDKYEVY